MADKAPKAPEAPEAPEAERLIKMTHESSLADDVLSIGTVSYEVVAGHVEVAAEHVEAAHAAGFRLG